MRYFRIMRIIIVLLFETINAKKYFLLDNEYRFYEKDMNSAFKPFKRYLKRFSNNKSFLDDMMGKYMYMFHDEKNQYYYKNSLTRDYFVLRLDSKNKVRNVDGLLDW